MNRIQKSIVIIFLFLILLNTLDYFTTKLAILSPSVHELNLISYRLIYSNTYFITKIVITNVLLLLTTIICVSYYNLSDTNMILYNTIKYVGVTLIVFYSFIVINNICIICKI